MGIRPGGDAVNCKEAKRQAKLESRLRDIADPTNCYSKEHATFAEALLMIIERLDREDEYQREQAEY